MRETYGSHVAKQTACFGKRRGLIARTNQAFESEAESRLDEGGGRAALPLPLQVLMGILI